MNIKELISEQQTDEGIGSALAAGARGLAKGTGAAIGGLAGMGSAFKQGYTGGKLAVAGGAPASGGGSSVGSGQSSIQQQIAQKQAEIAALKKQLGTPPVEPGIGQQQGKVAAVASNTPEPTKPETQPAAPAAAPADQNKPIDKSGKTDYNLGKQSDGKFIFPGQKFDSADGSPIGKGTPPVEPGIGQQQGNVAAVASNTPDPAKQSPEEIRKQKQAAATQVARDQMAASPAPAPTAAPAAPDPKAQQAALKARLQGQRSAGKSMATSTGSGFNQYVQGGGGQKLAGADAQGNPVFKQNVQRESVGYSKFLGCYI